MGAKKLTPATNSLFVASINLPSIEKLGIDNINKSFDVIVDITELGIQISEKFDYKLLIQFGLKITMHGNLVQVFKKALAEFKDLSAKESKLVAKHIKDRVDLKNDELEQRIESGIDLIERTYVMLPTIVDLGSDWVEWIRSWRAAAA